MKRHFNINRVLTCICSVTLFGLFSCVNNEYDLDELNTEITIAQNGLSLPLGNTEKLKLKDLMSELDQDVLTQINGAYALKMTENIDLSDNLPNLNEMLKLDDILFDDYYRYELSGLNAQNATINSLESRAKADVGQDLDTNIEIEQISYIDKTDLGLYEYKSKIKDFDLNSGFTDQFVTTSAKFSLPSTSITGDYTFPETNKRLTSKQTTIDLSLSSPDSNIENIRDIILENSSTMKVEVELSGHEFLKQGDIVPALTIDCGRLFSLSNSGTGSDSEILLQTKLNSANNFRTSENYTIESINVTEADWTGNTLTLSNPMNISGNLTLKNGKTDRRTLENYLSQGGTGEIMLTVNIYFGNIVIKSAIFDLKEIIHEENTDIPFSLGDGITLPKQLKSIDKIIFTNYSNLGMKIKSEQLNIPNLNAEVTSMSLRFPDYVKVENAENGIVNLGPFDALTDKDLSLGIESLDIPASLSAGGTITWNDAIATRTVIKLSGKGINSADLPISQNYDSSVTTIVNSSLHIEQWYATVNDCETDLTPLTQEITQDISGDISEFGTFTITPDGNPTIEITIDKPEKPAIIPAAGGLKISLPEFLRFKNIDPSYNYDKSTHSITLRNHIPETIRLYVDRLIISPQPKENNSGVEIKDNLTISGGIALSQESVSNLDIENIVNNGIGFHIAIPSMRASQVEINELKIDIDEKFETALITGEDFPSEIQSISEASLKDVYANFGITFSQLPDIGAGKYLQAELMVTLPKEIVLDQTDSRVNGNTLNISGIIRNNSFSAAPVKILEIDLSEYDFDRKPDLNCMIAIKGKLSADNPQLDLSQEPDAINANINVTIANIQFDRIIGKVDYVIDPTNENITLTDIPDMLKDENICLDIDNPYILLKAKTNIGIPMNGKLSITPVRKGVEAKDENISLNLSMKGSPTASKIDSTMFFIAAKNDGCPTDYQFIEAENIKEIIKKIPDELKLSFNARTSTETECIVEPQADYRLDVDYSLVAPLSFGQDLNIEISDTLTGFDKMIPELLNNNVIQLGGEVTNALPLQLDLKIQLLDNNNNIIPVRMPAKQVIKACASDGSPTTVPLDMTIDVGKEVNLTNFKGLLLTFKVTSGNVSGIPVTDESFVQAKISLKLPEGITMDLGDMNENMDEDMQ